MFSVANFDKLGLKLHVANIGLLALHVANFDKLGLKALHVANIDKLGLIALHVDNIDNNINSFKCC